MKNVILAIMVLAVVAAAGCTGQQMPWNSGTGGTNVESADLIVATNQPTIPSSPAADTSFTSRFTVKNQHTTKTAQEVGAWIYDTGKCTITAIGDAAPTKEGSEFAGFTIGNSHTTPFMPGQQEVVKLTVKAPSSVEIAKLPYTCPIRYRVSYKFDATSSVTADIISASRLNQLESQAGERPTYARTLNVGPGPMRIMMEPISTLPVQTGGELILEITVKNEGDGDIPSASIAANSLSFTVPDGFTNADCGGYFDCANNVCISARKIDLVQKQSSPMTCKFTVPDDKAVPVEKEYTITASLPGYSYSYFGQEIDVPITP